MYSKSYQYSLSVCPDYNILGPENCLKLPPPKSFYLKKCKNNLIFLKFYKCCRTYSQSTIAPVTCTLKDLNRLQFVCFLNFFLNFK